MSTNRITSQKSIILEYLKSVKTHPTAEEIFIEVRKKLPRISLSTVYRNLDEFSEKGEILELPGRQKHFDGNIEDHNHFICKKCDKIYDLFFNISLSQKNYKEVKKIGEVESRQIYFYGECKECIIIINYN